MGEFSVAQLRGELDLQEKRRSVINKIANVIMRIAFKSWQQSMYSHRKSEKKAEEVIWRQIWATLESIVHVMRDGYGLYYVLLFDARLSSKLKADPEVYILDMESFAKQAIEKIAWDSADINLEKMNASLRSLSNAFKNSAEARISRLRYRTSVQKKQLLIKEAKTLGKFSAGAQGLSKALKGALSLYSIADKIVDVCSGEAWKLALPTVGITIKGGVLRLAAARPHPISVFAAAMLSPIEISKGQSYWLEWTDADTRMAKGFATRAILYDMSETVGRDLDDMLCESITIDRLEIKDAPYDSEDESLLVIPQMTPAIDNVRIRRP